MNVDVNVDGDLDRLVVARFWERHRKQLQSLIDDELIEEHRRQPVGQHSDRLARVLHILRSTPASRSYVIVATSPHREWAVALTPRTRGEGLQMLPKRFTSLDDARHDVFLRRINELLIESRALSESTSNSTRDPSLVGFPVLGYANTLCVQPGERLRFMVHSEYSRFRASLGRLIGPAASPDAQDWFEEIDSEVNGEYAGGKEVCDVGSYVQVEDKDELLRLTSFTLHAFIYPTSPLKGRQAILSKWSQGRDLGYSLGINDRGQLACWIGVEDDYVEVCASDPLFSHSWYSVGVSFDSAGRELKLQQFTAVTSTNSRVGPPGTSRTVSVNARSVSRRFVELWLRRVKDSDEGSWPPFLMAAHCGHEGLTGWSVEGHYNGKLEAPRVYRRALSPSEVERLEPEIEPDIGNLVAHWDFSREIGPRGVPSDMVTNSTSAQLQGRCINLPTRATTGIRWGGDDNNYVHSPEQYAAIHFHDDDLEDLAWETSCELEVPADLRSGVYALRLRAADAEDHVPFFVRPRLGRETAEIVVLVPTATYLAYANQLLLEAPSLQGVAAQTPILDPADIVLSEKGGYGLSTYDRHSDTSGNYYSTALRPIVNLRPTYLNQGIPWGLPADLCLVGWLQEKGFGADFITDEDLDREGLDILKPYKVVLTGSHPEYVTSNMLDALETYLMTGGRLAYLGGNGFYWVTSFHPRRRHLIEVRKQAGSRAWDVAPGDGYHSSTGEPGGLWRHRNRAPQKLVGVGFAAQGFDESSHFRRIRRSVDSVSDFIFKGVDTQETIGESGLVGGAAGLELDRYDLALGTPPQAALLAASEDHTDGYQRVVEEILMNASGFGGTQDPHVRADLVFFTTEGGGAVFSTGSIAWCLSLPANKYQNDVSRITENVVRRFSSQKPFN